MCFITILHRYHDEVLSGHPGIRKLTETISRRYYFPGLHTIIRQYVISLFEMSKHEEKGRKCFDSLS